MRVKTRKQTNKLQLNIYIPHIHVYIYDDDDDDDDDPVMVDDGCQDEPLHLCLEKPLLQEKDLLHFSQMISLVSLHSLERCIIVMWHSRMTFS